MSGLLFCINTFIYVLSKLNERVKVNMKKKTIIVSLITAIILAIISGYDVLKSGEIYEFIVRIILIAVITYAIVKIIFRIKNSKVQ